VIRRNASRFLARGLTAVLGATVLLAGSQAAPALAAGKAEISAVRLDDNQLVLAECKGDRHVLGGGVVPIGSPDGLYRFSGPFEYESLEDGDVASWWLGWMSDPAGAGAEAKLLAICARAPKATVQVEPMTHHGSGYAGGSVTCPGKRRAVGGGVLPGNPSDVDNPNALYVEASGPLDAGGTTSGTDDGDVPKQWYAAVWSGVATPDAEVYAICARNSTARIEQTEFRVQSSMPRASSRGPRPVTRPSSGTRRS
jgi:hypothetical protein